MQIESLETRVLLATAETDVVRNEADVVMHSNVLRQAMKLTGRGVTIGVISDSFNARGGYSQDVRAGELPAGVTVLADGVGNDEGRAMMQLIHDIAPDAELLFHRAWGGTDDDEDIARAILNLYVAGADIIVDDVGKLPEPMLQDGKSAQAVDYVVARGVAYFSAAGNGGAVSYESAWRSDGRLWQDPLGNLVQAFDFEPGRRLDLLQQVTIPRGSTLQLALQWDDPFYSVTGTAGTRTDLDIWLFDEAGNVWQGGIRDNLWDTGDPVESLVWTNRTNQTRFNLAITLFNGDAPTVLKYIVPTGPANGIDINEYYTPSSTVYGHPNARGAVAVGASPWKAPLQLEPFSSIGTTPVAFGPEGDWLSPVDDDRISPTLVAPDRTSTTVPGFEQFAGTSAAAPSAAAVAALLKQARPKASPWKIYQAMVDSAVDMDDPYTEGRDRGLDRATGAGLLRADRAALHLLKLGGVSGRVFDDRDLDGRRDRGEKGLARRIVFIDANENGQLDARELRTRTNRKGNYVLLGLKPGRYSIEVGFPGEDRLQIAAGHAPVPVGAGVLKERIHLSGRADGKVDSGLVRMLPRASGMSTAVGNEVLVGRRDERVFSRGREKDSAAGTVLHGGFFS